MLKLARGPGAIAFAAIAVTPLHTAQAQSSETFRIADHSVGNGAGEKCWEGLCVGITIKQVNVPGLRGNSRICAQFRNTSGQPWAGGYRLSNNPANYNRTHASLQVPAQGIAERCETLSVTEDYFVVLRKNTGS